MVGEGGTPRSPKQPPPQYPEPKTLDFLKIRGSFLSHFRNKRGAMSRILRAIRRFFFGPTQAERNARARAGRRQQAKKLHELRNEREAHAAWLDQLDL